MSVLAAEAEDAGAGAAHDRRQVFGGEELAVLLDPAARLAVGAEPVLEGHVRAPQQPPRADALHHLFQGRPQLPVRVVEEVAQAHREADLQAQIGVVEWSPDPLGQHDPRRRAGGLVVEEQPPREAVGEAAQDVRPALHPARQDRQLRQVTGAPALQALGHRGLAGAGAEGEEHGHPEAGHRLPERPQVLPVPRVGAVVVGVGRVELDGVQAVVLHGGHGLGDDRVQLARQPPLVDWGHRADPLRIDGHRLRLEGRAAAEHGVHVEQDLVDAGVVHLGDQVVRGVPQVRQVGRVELLGAVLAVDGPHDPPLVVIDAEVDVGEVVEVHRPAGGGQHLGGGRRAVADAPGRLVVGGLSSLDPLQVVGGGGVAARGVGRREAVGVGVDDGHDSSRENS